jgi:NADH dehydrogenase (ubiquinone) Fe-S protein 8
MEDLIECADMYLTEKLLSNGDKWEPELAAVIRADAPYR